MSDFLPDDFSPDDFSQFRAMVLEDESLQGRLFAEAEIEAFAALAVQLAAERGLDITATEVRWAVQDARAGAIERWCA